MNRDDRLQSDRLVGAEQHLFVPIKFAVFKHHAYPLVSDEMTSSPSVRMTLSSIVTLPQMHTESNS